MNSSDIPFIIKDIKNEMPVHTENTGKIPSTYESLPKNFMDKSHKVDNKFLNNHLSEIEEAADKKLMQKNSFIQQQVKYHKESGILNHDNFFHCDLATGTPISNDKFHHSNFLIDPFSFTAPCLDGVEVQVPGVSATTLSAANTLYGAKINGAQADRCYDEIAISVDTASGLNYMGNYTDNGGVPDALIASTGSIAMASGYTYKSVPEWTQDGTTNVWCGYIVNNATAKIDNLNYNVVPYNFRRYTGTVTYELPNPFNPINSFDHYPHQMKIKHS